MGRTCRTYERGDDYRRKFNRCREGKSHLIVLGVDGGNIKMDLKEVGCEGVDWIQLAQDSVQRGNLINTVIKLPSCFEKGGKSLDYLSHCHLR
jgi:hypothetical protein